MSKAINDIEDEEKGKNKLVSDEDDLNKDLDDGSKNKLILVYAATVGGVLLIIVIVFLISLKFGGTVSKDNTSSLLSSNLFISKYSVDEENEVVKLFSSKFIGYISLMIIDGKKIENIVNNYNFTKKGNHTVQLEFKENCESLDYLFYNCPKLIEVNINEVKVKQLKNMRGLFSESGRLTKVTFGKNFTTSNVTDIREMFKDCTSLTTAPTLPANKLKRIKSYKF